jgi:hypothetical protein
MTDDGMALAQLLEKGSDSDLLREMIAYVVRAICTPKRSSVAWRGPVLRCI